MKFTKMQGIGNDYVYIYGSGDSIKDVAAFVRKISDRHLGIGSDGLILIDPSDTYDFRMRMYNADGSESPMCGNGSRCVGKFVYDKGYTDQTEIELETGAGLRHLTLFPENGKVKTVKVDMGRPGIHPKEIPAVSGGVEIVNRPFRIEQELFYITCVSMGNPHVVLFVPDVAGVDTERWGPLFECHPFFPERTNVEFVEVVSRKELKMRVWERGAGETQACGTGACASLVAAVLNAKCERKAVVHLVGGDLQVEWADDGRVYMTGGAEIVFEGEIFEEEKESEKE